MTIEILINLSNFEMNYIKLNHEAINRVSVFALICYVYHNRG